MYLSIPSNTAFRSNPSGHSNSGTPLRATNAQAASFAAPTLVFAILPGKNLSFCRNGFSALALNPLMFDEFKEAIFPGKLFPLISFLKLPQATSLGMSLPGDSMMSTAAPTSSSSFLGFSTERREWSSCLVMLSAISLAVYAPPFPLRYLLALFPAPLSPRSPSKNLLLTFSGPLGKRLLFLLAFLMTCFLSSVAL